MARRKREKVSGVYSITNIITRDQYIGHSVDIETRWTQHRFDLIRRYHHCFKLQEAWIVYGPKAFRFDYIERAETKDQCQRIEQNWLDLLRPAYNTSPFSCAGGHYSDRKSRLHSSRRHNQRLKTSAASDRIQPKTSLKHRLRMVGKWNATKATRHDLAEFFYGEKIL